MKKKLTILLVLICAVALVFTLSACAGNNSTGVVNGDFESFTDESLDSWTQVKGSNGTIKYVNIPSGSDEAAKRGARFIEITNSSADVTYLSQKVKLRKGVSYKMSVDMNISSRITGTTGDRNFFGAYFGFLEDSDFQELMFKNKTTDGWQTIEAYFVSSTSDALTLVAGIGSKEHGGGRGTVQFDNITLTQVDSIPAGITAGTVSPTSKIGGASVSTAVYSVLMVIVTLVAVYGLYYLMRKDKARPELTEEIKPKFWNTPIAYFLYVIFGALLVRLAFIMIFQSGMFDELTRLGNIALSIPQKGITNVYINSTTTLPTGIMYILSALGGIANATGIESGSVGMALLMRIPSLMADLVICYMIFNMISKHYGYKIGALSAGLFALLPMVFTLTAVWGAFSSVGLAFLIAAIYAMCEKKYLLVSIYYTLALLMSNFMLILLPLVILYYVYYMIKDKKSRVLIPISAVVCLIAFYSLALPFTINQVSDGNFLFVFKKMYADLQLNTIIAGRASTGSTFNMYAIFGLGNSAVTLASRIITALLMCCFIAGGAYMYQSNPNRLDLILLGAMSLLLYATFGVGVGIEIYVMGIVLLMIYAIMRQERRVYHAFAALAVLGLINVAMLVGGSGYLSIDPTKEAGISMIYQLNAMYIIGSLLSTAIVIYLAYVTYSVIYRDYSSEIEPLSQPIKSELNDIWKRTKRRITKKG